MFLILHSVKIGIDSKETKFETNQTWGPRLIDGRVRTKFLSRSNRGLTSSFPKISRMRTVVIHFTNRECLEIW
ncbi:hypothetical protein [Leptospira santarosai]|uniref:Uncharacterized protein n=1 Tax=Leptospira santarosai serovar Shermani str. LT 821 TaxID=758847 RepID=K8Y6G9_9LEPT|nr:hypothetical protein [Leptospira santarosai]EKT85390.1 hypothetical protein LSS_17885 [Leptospira santarosai serovar Shermani str. LT 821]EPG84100.1 hypothetical protein LEP1GSC048_0384 [Leptospira santarosai serovar Shermani str. 1342KT]